MLLGPLSRGTYTTFYMELIPCMNCVSVGAAEHIKEPKSFGDTFFVLIGLEDRFPRSLYKTCWLLVGVNFFVLSDDCSRTGSSSNFSIGEVCEDG